MTIMHMCNIFKLYKINYIIILLSNYIIKKYVQLKKEKIDNSRM